MGRTYRALARRQATRRLARSIPAGACVHLGCGTNRWEGWTHVDLSRAVHPDVVHDLRAGLPLPPGHIRLVYSEHVVEHLMLEDAIRLFADVAVALEPSGVMRIAMPDLDAVIDRYGRPDWRDQEWLQDPAYAHIDSPARMLNASLREWGHKYLYGYDELELRLRAVGFTTVRRTRWGESDLPEMRGRETRADSLLVVEASRPG